MFLRESEQSPGGKIRDVRSVLMRRLGDGNKQIEGQKKIGEDEKTNTQREEDKRED